MKNLFTCLIGIIMIAQVSSSYAQAKMETEKTKDWVLLGSKDVDYKLSNDVVSLNKKDIYTTLKLVVNDSSINVHRCTIHFVGSTTQDVSFSAAINREQTIDLSSNTKGIEKIRYWYDTKSGMDAKGVVEVWGSVY